ncbi:MAG: L-histidine N(alpha)-methyltransferase [Acetobacteraceae bacterium]|nr:L-histidine N(alpha)-methyltransferase [Acetobacteraceae bacterium]
MLIESAPGALTFDRAVADAALPGLLAARKTLPAKLFYDDEGCRLFGEITRLPEYYPTRTELALLREVAPEAVVGVPSGSALVEYGASDEGKATLLLDAAPAFAAYVPIDVAAGALATLAARLRRSRPKLAVHPVVADFLAPFALPRAVAAMPRTGFFPGSTIGNLEPAEAHRFLATTRQTLGAGARFLVGVDLRKDPAILVPAYDDAQGVTAAFNLNLLRRLNREAGADFDLDAFAHRAAWNPAEGRIEMHLVSLRPQTVRVAGHRIAFAAGETVHTENSYKHTEAGFQALAASAGWRAVRVWTDSARLFSLHLLAAPPQ